MMGEIRNFNIEFTDNQTVYYGGETLCGEVVLDLYKPLKVKEFKLRLFGRSEVHFNEDNTFYFKKEEYIDKTIILFRADESNGDGSEIPVGKTAFSFMFDLQASSKLPSSFESYNGYVRYTLNASIDKKVFSGYSCKRAITVLAHLNLNDENNVEKPSEVSTDKQLGCLFLQSGRITGILRLNKTGYAPGETILVKVEVRNASRKTCTCQLFIIKYVKVFSSTKTFKSISYIYMGEERTVDPAMSDIRYENIVIPSTPPSYLQGCNIIDIKYELKAKFCPDGCHGNFSAVQDIVIGTVALGKDIIRNYQPYSRDGFRIKEFPDNALTFGQFVFSPEYPYYGCLNKEHEDVN